MSLRRMLPVIAASLILFTSQAFGQQPAHRVGVLANMRLPETVQAWTEGLRERGYIEGHNLLVAYRYWQARTEQIPVLVSELLAFDPEIMVAATPQSAVAIHTAASAIPMVFLNVADPVALGLVASLAHPGGKVTGFSTLAFEGFVRKQLQVLKEFVPKASRIAVLINPTNPLHPRELPKLPEIGRLLGVEVFVVEASKPDKLEQAFGEAHKQGADGDPHLR